jgi:type IV pilus assembly protein PilC
MATQTFNYEALDSSGALLKGTMESASADAVAKSLSSQRLVPLQVSIAGVGLKREITLPGFGQRINARDLSIFARQFSSMMAAGLTLLRALGILEEQTTKPKLRAAIGAVVADLQTGVTLSGAMAKHADVFPELMVNMVRAGETGGFLDEALTRIAKMYESDAALRGKIKSALTYPVVVLIFAGLLGTGVIIFIVPVFEHLFKQLNGQLPLPTKIMVTLSHNVWWILPLVLAVIFGTLRTYRLSYRNKPGFRMKADQLKLRLPVFGPLIAKIAIARWARNLGTLLHVGVPLIQALDVVGGTSGNAVISEAMIDVKSAVRAGIPMSTPLRQHPFFPSMVIQMVEVGEESGQITEMLDKVADFYEEEVSTATESLTSAMEPLLVVMMGIVIGTMVICLYLPMFDIYKNIKTN